MTKRISAKAQEAITALQAELAELQHRPATPKVSEAINEIAASIEQLSIPGRLEELNRAESALDQGDGATLDDLDESLRKRGLKP